MLNTTVRPKRHPVHGTATVRIQTRYCGTVRAIRRSQKAGRDGRLQTSKQIKHTKVLGTPHPRQRNLQNFISTLQILLPPLPSSVEVSTNHVNILPELHYGGLLRVIRFLMGFLPFPASQTSLQASPFSLTLMAPALMVRGSCGGVATQCE